MKILFNIHSKKYLPIVIEDTSDMDKVIDTFEEWLKDSANVRLLELDFTLMEGHYSLTEEWEGVLHLVELTDNDYVEARYYTTSYDFELRDLSIIETPCRSLIFNGNDIGMLLSDKNVDRIYLIDDIDAFDLLEKDADDETLENVTSGGTRLSYFGTDYIGTIAYDGMCEDQMDYDQVTGVSVWYHDGTEIFINKNFKKEITIYK